MFPEAKTINFSLIIMIIYYKRYTTIFLRMRVILQYLYKSGEKIATAYLVQ